MKMKRFAGFAVVVLAVASMAASAAETIGVTIAGFSVTKKSLNPPGDFAIDSMAKAQEAVASGYVQYSFGPVTKRVVAGYVGDQATGRFNYEPATSDSDPGGFAAGRWEWSGNVLFGATGTITVPSAGKWTLALGGVYGSWTSLSVTGHGVNRYETRQNTNEDEIMLVTVDFPSAGEYAIEVFEYSPQAGAWMELSAAKGERVFFDRMWFNLIGVPVADYDPEDLKGWKLSWSDEFDGMGQADTETWGYETGLVRNNELQAYVDGAANAWQANGNLVIETRKEAWGKGKNTANYTSASLITKGKRTFRYGKYVFRAKIPTGKGLWPVIWMMGGQGNVDWPGCGEIDIQECYWRNWNNQGTPFLMSNFCWAGDGNKRDYPQRWNATNRPVETLDPQGSAHWSSEYHTWVMDWDEDRISLYVDGQYLNSQELDKALNGTGSAMSSAPSGTSPFRQPMFILLNLPFGGQAGGQCGIDESVLPAQMMIDYIRVYRKARTTDGLVGAVTAAEVANEAIEEEGGGEGEGEGVGNVSLPVADNMVLPANVTVARFANVFGSDMVLQRDSVIPVWGFAPQGTEVAVKLDETSQSATADETGRWIVTFPAISTPGGSHTLALSVGGETVATLTNIAIGDVWLCTGQSNMEMSISWGNLTGASEALAAAGETDNLRFFIVPRTSDRGGPHADVTPGLYANDGESNPSDQEVGVWKTRSAECANAFSAAGLFFALKIQPELGIPIGLISSCKGGTDIEAWMSAGCYNSLSGIAKRDFSGDRFNPMTFPLFPMAVKGAIWYQGCNNVWANNQQDYDVLLPAMVDEWRRNFTSSGGPFPFYIVALSAPERSTSSQPIENGWAEMRWIQHQLGESIPNSGTITTIDVGGDLHPGDKRTVGDRLARMALVRTYGRTGVADGGPRPLSATGFGDTVVVSFANAAHLATSDGEYPSGFQVAGPDRGFKWADAAIVGDKVHVYAPAGMTATYVRHAWDTLPVRNLVGDDGIPCDAFELAAVAPAVGETRPPSLRDVRVVCDATSRAWTGSLVLQRLSGDSAAGTQVYVAYGTADGGDARSGWQNAFRIPDTTAEGNYAFALPGLTAGTTYYLKAFAENGEGVNAAGSETLSFLTPSSADADPGANIAENAWAVYPVSGAAYAGLASANAYALALNFAPSHNPDGTDVDGNPSYTSVNGVPFLNVRGDGETVHANAANVSWTGFTYWSSTPETSPTIASSDPLAKLLRGAVDSGYMAPRIVIGGLDANALYEVCLFSAALSNVKDEAVTFTVGEASDASSPFSFAYAQYNPFGNGKPRENMVKFRRRANAAGQLVWSSDRHDNAPYLYFALTVRPLDTAGEEEGGGEGGGEGQEQDETTFVATTWTGIEPADNNLFKGVTPVLADAGNTTSGHEQYINYGGTWDAEIGRLTDGLGNSANAGATYYAIRDDAKITWKLSAPAALDEFRFYSGWSDTGRAGVAVAAIEVRVAGSDEWVPLGDTAFNWCEQYSNDDTISQVRGAVARRVTLARANGAPFAENVTDVRVTFGRQDNFWCGYAEIEAIGRVTGTPGADPEEGGGGGEGEGGENIATVSGFTIEKKLMGAFVAPDWHYEAAPYTDLASALADTGDHWNQSGTFAVVAGYIGDSEKGDFNYDNWGGTGGPTDGGFPAGRFQWDGSTLFTCTATLVVPSAGKWTIVLGAATGSDFLMTIGPDGAAQTLTTSDYDVTTRRAVKTFEFQAAGNYPFSLQLYRNATGVAFAEFSCAKGEVAAADFSTTRFMLVGKAAPAVVLTPPHVSGISFANGKVGISVDNAVKGVRYGYKFSESLEGLATAKTVWLEESATADGLLEIPAGDRGTSGFFRIVVTDRP